jgi:hypothetical protein
LTDTDESMPTFPVQQQTIKPLPTEAAAAASKEQSTPAQSDLLDDNHQLDKAFLDKFQIELEIIFTSGLNKI